MSATFCAVKLTHPSEGTISKTFLYRNAYHTIWYLFISVCPHMIRGKTAFRWLMYSFMYSTRQTHWQELVWYQMQSYILYTYINSLWPEDELKTYTCPALHRCNCLNYALCSSFQWVKRTFCVKAAVGNSLFVVNDLVFFWEHSQRT